MAFPIEEKYINETEQKLGIRFPEKFRQKMMQENAGRLESRESGEIIDWYLYPFFDKSDKKRIARICNHIELETNKARKWSDFPENGIAIAADGGGNHLVLLPSEIDDSQLGEETYDWFHETGELIKVADSIIELLPKDEAPVVNRKFKTRKKDYSKIGEVK